MDINDFDTTRSDGVKMQVKHPSTGEPLTTEDGAPTTITLVGVDSDRYQAVLNSQIDRRLQVGANNRLAQPTARDIDRESIDLFVAATVGWSGITHNGEEFAFSAENARIAYQKLPWLRAQVKEFIENRANFLRASAAI